MSTDELRRLDEATRSTLRGRPPEEVNATVIALLEEEAASNSVDDEALLFIGLELAQAGQSQVVAASLAWLVQAPAQRLGAVAALLNGLWRSGAWPLPAELAALDEAIANTSPTLAAWRLAADALATLGSRSNLPEALRAPLAIALLKYEPHARSHSALHSRLRQAATACVQVDQVLDALDDRCETCGGPAVFTGAVTTRGTQRYAVLRCDSCRADMPVWNRPTEALLDAWMLSPEVERLALMRTNGFQFELDSEQALPLVRFEVGTCAPPMVEGWVELLLTSPRWRPTPSATLRWAEALRVCVAGGGGLRALRAALGGANESTLLAAVSQLKHVTNRSSSALLALALSLEGAGLFIAAQQVKSIDQRDLLARVCASERVMLRYTGGHRHAPDSPGGQVQVEVNAQGEVTVENWRGEAWYGHWRGTTRSSLLGELLSQLQSAGFPNFSPAAGLVPGSVPLRFEVIAGAARVEASLESGQPESHRLDELLRLVHRLASVASQGRIALGHGAAPPFTPAK